MSETRSIEETFETIDGLIQKLERDELSMEESFEAYARGLALLKECRESIDKVEKNVLVLDESGDLHEL